MELGISFSGFLGSSLLSQEPQFIAGRVFIVFHNHWISVLQSLKRREALGPEAVLASSEESLGRGWFSAPPYPHSRTRAKRF